MSELRGTLELVGLARLLEFLGKLRKTGRLAISDRSITGALFLEEGRVVGAAFGTQTGETALDSVAAAMGKAHFTFLDGVVEQQMKNLALDPAGLERHLEELSETTARLAQFIPSLTCVLVRSDQASSDDDVISIDRGALRRLLNCDGRRTVIDLARDDGVVPTLTRVARLVELGLVHCMEEVGGNAPPVGLEADTLSTDQPPELAPHATGEAMRGELGRRGAWARWRRPVPQAPRQDG